MNVQTGQKSHMTAWCLMAFIMVICAVALGVILFFAPGHGQSSVKTTHPPGLKQ